MYLRVLGTYEYKGNYKPNRYENSVDFFFFFYLNRFFTRQGFIQQPCFPYVVVASLYTVRGVKNISLR